MATEKTDAAVEEIQKKVDKLSKKLDDVAKSVKGLDSTKKLDDLVKSVKEIEDSKESTVIIKKLDDVLVSLADGEVVPKKLDDLQNYLAEFSGIEEKVQDLANQFEETKEIVGIIVRQLDDIERKYNVAIDKVTEAVETLTEFVKAGPAATPEPKKPTKKPKETKEEKPKVTPPDKASLPSTIDALMDNLMTLVVPQTEATEMAEALEEVRDELTTMIKGHTPVLFQFGKRARELKSYPPTATLNENDIASLSREIKSWKGKLKEVASSS
jgi:chromosome segregation ATPase